MTETSYPSPNHNSRNVTDKEYETLSPHNGDGVHGLPSDGAVVVPGVGLQVLIKAGTKATLRGHAWDAGSTDVPLAISANAGSDTRYDWITLRLDRSTWDVSAHVIQGTPGAGYPAYTNDVGDTGTFDMCLALATVAPGAAAPTITQATRFAPARITVANSGEAPFGTKVGDQVFRPDTGTLEIWDGGSYNTVYRNTGWLTLGAGFSTWEDYVRTAGMRQGDTCHLRIAKRRIDGTFSANDSDGSKLATLPAELTPRSNHWFPVSFTGSAGTAIVEIRTTGEVWVVHNQKDVTAGRVLLLSCSYPIG